MSASDSSSEKTRFELLDPDVRLMLAVRDGDAAAFEKLVEKHQGRLVTVLEHLVGNRSRAEELAQDVFLRVYRARERYVPKAKFSTWLYTITHNVASNAVRKKSTRKEVNLVSSPSGSMPVRPLDTMAKDKSALIPTRMAAQKEMADLIAKSIDSLGPRQKMAMLLNKVEGMSYNEIAETMELTPQAVKSLLSRARMNLREKLAPYMNTGNLPTGVATELDD
ncbi:MAG: sigma-70 family RNA polymerase sigma factor [Planctomycetota bacterium]